MVKYARRYGYRRWRRRASFNYIASHYLKYKIKNSYTVNLNQDNISGDVSLTFQAILESGTNDFTQLSKHFLQYKVTGVAIHVIPSKNTAAGGEFNFQGVKVAMSILNVNEDLTYAAVSKSPNAILLGEEKVNKYYKLDTDWVGTSVQAAPAMKICTTSQGIPLTGQMTYNFIVTMYMIFKNPA